MHYHVSAFEYGDIEVSNELKADVYGSTSVLLCDQGLLLTVQPLLIVHPPPRGVYVHVSCYKLLLV